MAGEESTRRGGLRGSVKLWGGRFRAPTAPELERLGHSIHFDQRLWAEDIDVNRAYARELHAVRLLDDHELETLLAGLDRVGERLREEPPLDDEDIHTAVERILAEEISPEIAAKLPTGRSRNDLAATELRIYVARAIALRIEELRRLQSSLLEKAKAHTKTMLPGYTHLRRGQPVVFAQYLLAYFWTLERDHSRLAAARSRCRQLPLGAGALAGNPFGVDRRRLAEALDFDGVLPNSIDAVSARDHLIELLSAVAILGTHLSRMAEDLILFSSAEFGFVSLDERYATGSSIMPQKQNPDGLELTRGKAGRLIGDLVALLTAVKGLPTGYQRDLQEDKEPVFDALDTLALVLPVMDGIVRTLVVNEHAMAEALSSDLLATDLAEYLVRKGVPFRTAHETVGRVLALASEMGVEPQALSLEQLEEISSAFDDDVASVWSFEVSIALRDTEGGVSPRALEEQLTKAFRALDMPADPE